MSVSGFAASFLIYGYFLPLLFFYNIISLTVIALWNGQPVSTVLQDIVSIEDDICLPYPPGYFNFLKLRPQGFQDEHSLKDDFLSSDASTVDDSDESILSVTQEIAWIVPVIIVTDDSNDDLPGLALGDDSSFLPKDEHDFFDMSASHDLDFLRPVPIRSAVSMTTSDSRHEENISMGADYFPSSSTSERQYVLTEVADPTRSSEPVVNSSKVDSFHEEIASPQVDCDLISLPSLASGLVEESGELDLTEEEEAILETLCIQMPDVAPTVEQLAENPHVPARVPIFSRHNISDKIVFPVRKPSSPPSPPPPVQSRSSTLLENVNSMVSKTRAELQQRRDRSGPLSSMISSKFSDISNARVFSRKARDSMIPEWIRNSVEHARADDYYEEEESSLGVTFKSTLGYFKV